MKKLLSGLVLAASLAGASAAEYKYDTVGRLTTKVHSDGTVESFTYDAEGNILSSDSKALPEPQRQNRIHAQHIYGQLLFDGITRTNANKGEPYQLGGKQIELDGSTYTILAITTKHEGSRLEMHVREADSDVHALFVDVHADGTLDELRLGKVTAGNTNRDTHSPIGRTETVVYKTLTNSTPQSPLYHKHLGILATNTVFQKYIVK